MSYRGPNPTRAKRQAGDFFRYAGHTAIWNQWVSATPGTPAAGIGPEDHYRQQLITGLFGDNRSPRFLERQGAAGMVAAGDVFAVTREHLDRRDTIDWNGESYRVDSDPVKSQLDGLWVCILKRGE